MKKIQEILISTRTMAVLLLVYAVAMAVATFVENDYGTPAAKALIYNAKWFEVVMFLLILNFVGNIKRYRLMRREKWPVLVFHLAFILIFIGGAITRYISYEGMMHIREGETTNEIVSDRHFLKVRIEDGGDVLSYPDKPYLMSPLSYKIRAAYDFHGQRIDMKGIGYIQRKKDSLVPNASGKEYLHIVSAGESGRVNYYLSNGETKSINGMLVSFNKAIEGAVEFKKDGNQLLIRTPEDAEYMTMATQETGVSKKDEFQPLALRSLYTIGNLRLVVPEGLVKGNLTMVEGDRNKDQTLPDLLRLEIKGPKTTQIAEIPVQAGNPELARQFNIDGMNLMIGYGPTIYNTPFAVKLDRFVLDTYPGSDSPSSFESYVQIIDNGKSTPEHIYMNNVLNYKGYRFFQSSYDPDRRGTVLSVNHDFWGTLITYIGYIFLFVGLFVSLFWKGTHFWKLNNILKQVSKRKLATLAGLLVALNLQAQTVPSIQNNAQNSTGRTMPATRIIPAEQAAANTHIDKDHADKFGYLLVQNYEGRIKPMNTMALDVLRKLYKHESFHGLTANQWFLAISTDPMLWTQVPIIKVGPKGGDELKKLTRANDDGYTSLINLFPAGVDGMPHFALEKEYNIAFRKKPAEQTNYDKEVIAVNDRVQVFNGILSGQYLRVVPVKNDINHRWNSWLNEKFESDQESQDVMGPYFMSVVMATQNGDWQKADAELEALKTYQQTWGKNVIPSETKIKAEVLMNKLNLFFKLLIFYTLVGGLLLILAFVELFRPSKTLHRAVQLIIAIGVVGYIIHLLGLGLRWYVSGHAPWSNGYEAIVFISWVGITAGLALYRNSNALIPAAGFLVAVIMMGFAHGGSQLDPQITPLVPVLKSYWLIIHVAIITSSYGFFALSMLIAVITLMFYIVANRRVFKRHNEKTIRELTIVSEMSLTIGLFALTVGNFLGGVWANESWGRYWSWDPKETWAFISIIVYAFVIHMRLVPGLRGRYTYHVVTLFAFCSMVMTYFGVNYYLSGLHSYAAGDPVPVPAWVYIGLATMTTLSIVAWLRYKKHLTADKKSEWLED